MQCVKNTQISDPSLSYYHISIVSIVISSSTKSHLSSCIEHFGRIHYATLHYTTLLQYTSLYYTTQHYTTVQNLLTSLFCAMQNCHSKRSSRSVGRKITYFHLHTCRFSSPQQIWSPYRLMVLPPLCISRRSDTYKVGHCICITLTYTNKKH